MTGLGGPRIPQRLKDVLITAIVSLVLVGGSGYLYTNHVQRQADRRHDQLVRDSERKWCSILNIFTGGPPSETERGKVIAGLLSQLRSDLGC